MSTPETPPAERLCLDLADALGIEAPESVRLYGPGNYVFMVLEVGLAEKLLSDLRTPTSPLLAPVSSSEDTPARVWQEGDLIPAHVRSVYGKRTQHFRQADDQNRGADGWWSPGTGVISERRLLSEHGPVREVPAGGEPA